MKIIVLLTLLITSYFTVNSQQEVYSKWLISANFAIQEPDTRLFGFPEIPKRNLLARQKENPRTYQLDIRAARNLVSTNIFKLAGGIGLSSELNTFNRPFFHGYGATNVTDILLFTDKYHQYLFQIPIQTKLNILKSLAISLKVLPQLNFLTTANDTKGFGSTRWWRFEFYSVEINPGLVWTTKRLDIGMSYRYFHFKRIDPILFHAFMSTEPDTDRKFETFNPFKLWFSVGYKF